MVKLINFIIFCFKDGRKIKKKVIRIGIIKVKISIIKSKSEIKGKGENFEYCDI